MNLYMELLDKRPSGRYNMERPNGHIGDRGVLWKTRRKKNDDEE